MPFAELHTSRRIVRSLGKTKQREVFRKLLPKVIAENASQDEVMVFLTLRECMTGRRIKTRSPSEVEGFTCLNDFKDELRSMTALPKPGRSKKRNRNKNKKKKKMVRDGLKKDQLQRGIEATWSREDAKKGCGIVPVRV